MPATKVKPVPQLENGNGIIVEPAEVLTLAEAAAYLRVADTEVIRMVDQQNLPGRLIGQEWRFLKSALRDWLGSLPPRPSKEAVLSRIGSWQGDPYLEQELAETHRRRGRPVTTDDK